MSHHSTPIVYIQNNDIDALNRFLDIHDMGVVIATSDSVTSFGKHKLDLFGTHHCDENGFGAKSDCHTITVGHEITATFPHYSFQVGDKACISFYNKHLRPFRENDRVVYMPNHVFPFIEKGEKGVVSSVAWGGMGQIVFVKYHGDTGQNTPPKNLFHY